MVLLASKSIPVLKYDLFILVRLLFKILETELESVQELCGILKN